MSDPVTFPDAMHGLGFIQKARVAVARPLSRWLIATPVARQWLMHRRRKALDRGLDPDMAAILAMDDLAGESALWRLSPAKAWLALAESVATAEDQPLQPVATRDLWLDGAAGKRPGRLYEPAGLARPSVGLVYIHGGGWVTGNIATHDTLCRRLAVHGQMRVVSVEPGLAPEHRFPAPVDDALRLFASVVAGAQDLGIDPRRLGVGGDSAGGNLSAVVALEMRQAAARPALALLLYPALDATLSQPSHAELREGFFLTRRSIDWYLGHYTGGDTTVLKNPRLSPLFAEDLTGAPPTIIAICGFDPLRDEGEVYVERLRQASVVVERYVYPGFVHGFALMTGLCPAAMTATIALAEKTGAMLRAA